jgi:hypothetical protein
LLQKFRRQQLRDVQGEAVLGIPRVLDNKGDAASQTFPKGLRPGGAYAPEGKKGNFFFVPAFHFSDLRIKLYAKWKEFIKEQAVDPDQPSGI